MPAPIAEIGGIKFFDPAKKSGVIEEVGTQQKTAGDLYFEVSEEQALRLRVGQLVRFLVEQTPSGAEAKDIAVLSQKA